METHCLFLQVQCSFFVIDDACVLKILKHTMTDEDDVISTRIQASIDFPVNKKNTIKFCRNVLSRICHFMARSNEEGNLFPLFFSFNHRKYPHISPLSPFLLVKMFE